MIEHALKDLLTQLSNHHRNKDEILYAAVAHRLEQSFNAYDEELLNSLNYLKNRRPDRLMRKMTK